MGESGTVSEWILKDMRLKYTYFVLPVRKENQNHLYLLFIKK